MYSRSLHIIIATHFLLLMLVQAFSGAVLYADYLISKKAYEAYCENKQKPELHCDGQCQLAKKIAAEEEKHAPQAPGAKAQEWPVFAPVAHPIVLAPALQALEHYSFVAPYFPTPYPASLFHPPNGQHLLFS